MASLIAAPSLGEPAACATHTTSWRIWVLLSYGALLLVSALAVYALFTGGVAPLALDGCLAGVLAIALPGGRQALANHEHSRRYRELQDAYALQGKGLARRLAELEWLRDLSKQVNMAATLGEVLDVTYEGVRKGLGYDRVGINLFDYEAGIYEDCIGTDAAGRKIVPHDRTVDLDPQSPIWQFPGVAALLDGAEYYYTADAAAECPPELAYLFDGLPAHNLMVSLRAGEKVVGMISVDNLISGRPFSPDEAGPLLSLAHQVGLAVERVQALEALRHQALHDALTGLANRALLRLELDVSLERAERAARPVSLLLIDLDRFKEINDTLGHHVGDQLLPQVGARLIAAMPKAATVARLGGDEFAVLLPMTEVDAAQRLSRRVLEALEAPFLLDGQALSVAASIGVALFPDHGTDAQSLLRCADVAMYTAKRAQSGMQLYNSEHDEHSAYRLSLMGDLRQALAEDDQLTLYYQPKVAVVGGRPRGVEALLRWQHPVHGWIPPDHFIGLAEQTSVIMPLTRWTLQTALHQARRWLDDGRPCPVAVNLSALSLRDEQLPAQIAGLLENQGVAPAYLVLEVTESALMADPAQALSVLEGLAALGVRIAIDDFGTGYSSLGYLKRLPVHEVKIDRSFVAGMEEEHKDRAIVQSVIALAHALDLEVVAEGVERESTLALLQRMGCDIAQGYLIGRPVPAVDIQGAPLPSR